MSDVKVSGLPSDTSLDSNHYVPVNDPTGPTTKRTLLSTLAAFFFNQTNIPAGTGSPVTRGDEMLGDFVYSGLVITGDSYGVNRNASMTAGTVYINGLRISIAAVTARTYTASKDTYADVLSNGDGTGTLVYTEVANGAAAPALAANSVRIGKVVTGATTIAAATSIVQYGVDSLANPMRPTGAARPANNTYPAYSSVEVLTGETWIDGRPIYRKVLTGNMTVVAGTVNVAHGISGISSLEILRIAGNVRLSSTTRGASVNTFWHRETGGNWGNPTSMDGTNVNFVASFAWGSSAYTFILEYVR